MKPRPEPWVKTHYQIKARCNSKKSRYYKRGILCLITADELRQLWVRDKACDMKKPSIDRIDNKGNYEYSNCRYIEHSENARLGNIGKKLNPKQLETVIKNIDKVNKSRITCRRVSNYLNGKKHKTFNSISEAARYYNTTFKSIRFYCIGLRKKKLFKGFEWRFEDEN
ncbi:MAG: hypothetical protein U9O94_02925 [Nanoarchaeota archaeon]|nr:hypothetical protein [Nanoarchaeota archaeon]